MPWRGETEDGLGWGGLVASKAEQRAEARQAALEVDAKRYRWLRQRYDVLCRMYTAQGLGLDLSKVYVNGPEKLDAVIDAAMRAPRTPQPADAEGAGPTT